jgi:hypothetical protein
MNMKWLAVVALGYWLLFFVSIFSPDRLLTLLAGYVGASLLMVVCIMVDDIGNKKLDLMGKELSKLKQEVKELKEKNPA